MERVVVGLMAAALAIVWAQSMGMGPFLTLIPGSTQPPELRFLELRANGSSWVSLRGNPSIPSSHTMTLPATPGSPGQALTTGSGGALGWSNVVNSVSGTQNEVSVTSGSTPQVGIFDPFDISGKSSTKSLKTMSTPPSGSCSTGELVFVTSGSIYGCSGGTWVNLTGGGGGAGIPSGAIAFFNLASCPSGWSEYTALRGRYVVGLPSGGTLEGTAGTALANLENRPTGSHVHPITDPGHSHDASHGHSVTDPGHSHGISHTHGITDPGHSHTYNEPTYPVFNYSTGTSSTTVSLTSVPSSTSTNTTGISVNSFTGNSSSATTGVSVNTLSFVTGSSFTGIFVNVPDGSVAGTPAPYVQLRACRKD